MQFFIRYKTLSIILTSFLTVFTFYHLLNLENYILNSKFIPNDSFSYYDAASLLYSEQLPHPYRPFGYPSIIGIPFLLFDAVSINFMIIFAVGLNILIWIWTTYIFQKTLSLFIDKRKTFLITLLSIANIGALSSVFYMLTETLTSFLLILLTYYLIKYWKIRSKADLFAIVGILNILPLVRPGFLYLAMLANISLFLFLAMKKIKLKKSFLVVVIPAFILLFQIFAIQRTYGKATISFIDKLAWYNYLGAQAYAEQNKIPFSSCQAIRKKNILRAQTYPQRSQISNIDFIEQVTSHPQIILKHWGQNMINNTKSGAAALSTITTLDQNKFNLRTAKLLHKISVVQNIFYVLLCFTTITLFVFSKSARSFIPLSLIIIVLYIIMTSGISFWQGDRFHFVFYHTSIIAFLITIKHIKQKNRYSLWMNKYCPH